MQNRLKKKHMKIQDRNEYNFTENTMLFLWNKNAAICRENKEHSERICKATGLIQTSALQTSYTTMHFKSTEQLCFFSPNQPSGQSRSSVLRVLNKQTKKSL